MPSGSRLKSKRAVPPSPIGPGLRSMGFSPILPGHAAETGFGRILGMADDCRRAGAGDCCDLPVGVWVRRLGWLLVSFSLVAVVYFFWPLVEANTSFETRAVTIGLVALVVGAIQISNLQDRIDSLEIDMASLRDKIEPDELGQFADLLEPDEKQ
jgi:hypothetical protein